MSPNFSRKKILPVLLTCLISLISAGTLVAQSNTWTSRTAGTTSILSGITYASGQFVIVGEDGTILTSPNGTSWTSRTSGTTEALRGICFGGGQFVATGFKGTIVTSPDGVTWTSRTSGTTQFLSGVAYGAGKFVAVGGFGTIVTSTDGMTWNAANSNTNQFLQGVTFADGQFLASGHVGALRASADGTVWSTVGISFIAGGDLFSASYFKGRYYSAGAYGFDSEPKVRPQCLSSTDLITWRDEALPASLTNEQSYCALATDGHTLIAVTDLGAIDANSDGQTWSNLKKSNNIPLYGASFGQGLFVTVGGGTRGVILTSPQNAVPNAFESWRSLEFTAAELADPEISGPQADPESDGIPNLVEFAHGLSPKSPDTNSDRLPGFRDPKPSGGSVDFEWTIDRDSIGRVNVTILYSETLASDSWQTLAVTPSTFESTDQYDTMIATDPSRSEPKCFYRFRYLLVE